MKRPPVDTRYLHSFHAVCGEGSFARAAALLHCTQPAISYQIRALERRMRTQLFERGGRRAILTAEGRELREFCERYFAEFDTLRNSIAGGGTPAPDPLRIATASGYGRYVLFPRLRRMMREPAFFNLKFDLRYRTAAEVIQLVERGECDAGFVYLSKISNYLRFLPAYDEELVLIAPARMARTALAGSRARRLATYESIDFVTYTEGDYVFGKWFEVLFKAQPAITRGTHHVDELEEVIDLVADGAGASILPLDSALAAARARRIRIVRPFKNHSCINRVSAVLRAGSRLRPEIEYLLNG